MRITHRIDGVPADEWPGYYKLVEFAIEKEKEILAETHQHKKTIHQNSRGTSVFRKPSWMNQKTMPSARMVAPSPEEDDCPNPTEQSSREDSDSGELYAAIEEQPISTVKDRVSKVNLEVVLRVAHVTEDMMGKCFRCGQGGHCWRDPEYPMYTQSRITRNHLYQIISSFKGHPTYQKFLNYLNVKKFAYIKFK